MLKQNFSEGQSSYHTLKSDVMWWGDMALLVGGARHLLRKLWCHQTLWKMTSRKKIFLSVNLGRSHWALRLFYFICFYFFFFVWMKSSVSAFFIFQDLWGNSEDRSQRVPLPGTGRGIAPQTHSQAEVMWAQGGEQRLKVVTPRRRRHFVRDSRDRVGQKR